MFISRKGYISLFLTLQYLVNNPLTREIHEEHNDTHCDFPSTFLFDEFASKSHS